MSGFEPLGLVGLIVGLVVWLVDGLVLLGLVADKEFNNIINELIELVVDLGGNVLDHVPASAAPSDWSAEVEDWLAEVEFWFHTNVSNDALVWSQPSAVLGEGEVLNFLSSSDCEECYQGKKN